MATKDIAKELMEQLSKKTNVYLNVQFLIHFNMFESLIPELEGC